MNNSDEVIVPNLTFVATANSVILAGGIPKFCDVKLDDFSIDLKQAEKLITEKTKAIIPVHLYGKTADMVAVNKFARKYKLNVIEDAAQGIGVFIMVSILEHYPKLVYFLSMEIKLLLQERRSLFD